MQTLIFGVLAFWGASMIVVSVGFICAKTSTRVRHWFMGDD